MESKNSELNKTESSADSELDDPDTIEGVSDSSHDRPEITSPSCSVSEPTSYINTGLLEYFKQKTIGKEILKHYKKCQEEKKILSKNIRSKVVRLVIEREKDRALRNVDFEHSLEKFVITTERFKILANEISVIFKGENADTYFTPFSQVGKIRCLASGKLWSHYCYTKDCLRQADLLEKRGKENDSAVYNVTNADESTIEWLKVHLEPWSIVKERWQESFRARRQLLQDPELSVQNYIDKFACLKVQDAKQLFALDLRSLHPECVYIDAEKFQKVKNCLISIYQEANVKNVEEQALLYVLKSGDLSSDKEDFILLYLLPHIITPKRSGKRKQKSTNVPHHLSLVERRESFIFVVHTATEIHIRLKELKIRLQEVGKTFQPVIVAVGRVPNIENFYVALNEQLFETHTILEAIELALTIFFSLDCRYPSNTETIWVFLQRIFMNIELHTDVLNVQLNVVLGHIYSALSS